MKNKTLHGVFFLAYITPTTAYYSAIAFCDNILPVVATNLPRQRFCRFGNKSAGLATNLPWSICSIRAWITFILKYYPLDVRLSSTRTYALLGLTNDNFYCTTIFLLKLHDCSNLLKYHRRT